MKIKWQHANTLAFFTLAFTFVTVITLSPNSQAEESEYSIDKLAYGTAPDGSLVTQYSLANSKGMIAKFIDYGAILTELHVPSKNGTFEDIVLGCTSVEDYATISPYFGCTTGRYANRIANGKFSLDGKEYTLATNNAPNHLHGGTVGFNKVMWNAETYNIHGEGVGIIFTYTSPDMEEGYPGELKCKVEYFLTNKNELKIEYTATTDKKTIVNLTHHSYFNLAGQGKGTILDHSLMIAAKNYTPTDETFIPTGEIAPVAGTPFDFTTPKLIGKHIAQVEGGYDLNYVLDSQDGRLALAARVEEPTSGRVMEVWTTEPGIQFYTGNFLDGTIKGKDGKVYEKNYGFCLETQHYPNSPNQPDFPSTVLEPGKNYRHTCVYAFGLK